MQYRLKVKIPEVGLRRVFYDDGIDKEKEYIGETIKEILFRLIIRNFSNIQLLLFRNDYVIVDDNDNEIRVNYAIFKIFNIIGEQSRPRLNKILNSVEKLNYIVKVDNIKDMAHLLTSSYLQISPDVILLNSEEDLSIIKLSTNSYKVINLNNIKDERNL